MVNGASNTAGQRHGLQDNAFIVFHPGHRAGLFDAQHITGRQLVTPRQAPLLIEQPWSKQSPDYRIMAQQNALILARLNL